MTDSKPPQPIDEAELRKQVIGHMSILQVKAIRAAGGTTVTSQEEQEIEELTDSLMSMFNEAVTAALKRVDEALPEMSTDERPFTTGGQNSITMNFGFNHAIREAHQAIANELSKWEEAE